MRYSTQASHASGETSWQLSAAVFEVQHLVVAFPVGDEEGCLQLWRLSMRCWHYTAAAAPRLRYRQKYIL